MDIKINVYWHGFMTIDARLDSIAEQLTEVIENQDHIMIDTKKILDEVTRARGELASYKVLAEAQNKIIADQASALATAIANSDPAAIAQVQADLDKAASDLATDDDAADAAIAANSPKPTP